jgi:hypothetical protein
MTTDRNPPGSDLRIDNVDGVSPWPCRNGREFAPRWRNRGDFADGVPPGRFSSGVLGELSEVKQ